MNTFNGFLFFKRELATDLRYFFLIFCAILTMILDFNYHALTRVRSTIAVFSAPIEQLITYPTKVYLASKQHFLNQNALQSAHTTLKTEHAYLVAKLQRFESLQKENDQLRSLLNTASKTRDNFLLASLLSVATDPFQKMLRLSKGTKENVHIGQAVLGDTGILGQIVRTMPSTSDVLLITDTRSAIPVMNIRNGLRSIAVGTNQDHALRLLHIANTLHLKEGDLFVTSGLGNRFSQGYPVGVVSHIQKLPGENFAEVVLKPSVAIDRANFVLLMQSTTES